jgi:hypothetical protein
MFTDQPVTPNRLECLIDLLREYSRQEWTRAKIIAVLQPKGLPDLESTSEQAAATIKAALELGLVTQDGGSIKLESIERSTKTPEVLLSRLDERVLASTDIEPYFAPFYSYLTGLGVKGTIEKSRVAWANDFNRDCPQMAGVQNPFNQAKHTGLDRWYVYTGHGWFDPEGIFQPNPYGRILRQLGQIFAGGKKLSGDEFLTKLGECCPELDNGQIFRRTCPGHNPEARIATLAVSHSLVDLHLDNRIRLHCAPDSRGWSIEAAQPPNDGKTLRSGRIDYVEACN